MCSSVSIAPILWQYVPPAEEPVLRLEYHREEQEYDATSYNSFREVCWDVYVVFYYLQKAYSPQATGTSLRASEGSRCSHRNDLRACVSSEKRDELAVMEL